MKIVPCHGFISIFFKVYFVEGKCIAMKIRRFQKEFNWENVPVLAYKEDGGRFKSITRRILFEGNEQLQAQLRYFEIDIDGHSTLECHNHLHVVCIMRGIGEALVGSEIVTLSPFDIVEIPSGTWHQFRATKDQPFGFLCLVNSERDRPQQPNATELAELKTNPHIADFMRT
jgi:quercetin dioxygenase-like cupin family protein